MSLILAAISAAALVYCLLAAVVYEGNAPVYTGAIGLGAALFDLYGAVISFKDLYRKKNRTMVTYLGAVFSSVLFLGWAAVILYGIKG